MSPGSPPDFPERIQAPLIEGRDYTWENGLMVMTAAYLLRRGYCCENGCRNCPYENEAPAEPRQSKGSP